ncbi:MAG: molybdenum cofactor biosynthesis protein MoaE [Spirochaetia bacterium]|nr:molybdenum cofactor biosynthesis protein MoaE [Spirochaetia bacterium]
MNYLSETNINIIDYIDKIHHPKAGAVVVFCGEARNHNHDKPVKYLEYEAHTSLANKVINEIIKETKKKWKLHDAFCAHRTGKVNISETAVIVITLSSHRKEAYEANQFIINKLKHEAPIWKKEYYTDGTTEWSKELIKTE